MTGGTTGGMIAAGTSGARTDAGERSGRGIIEGGMAVAWTAAVAETGAGAGTENVAEVAVARAPAAVGAGV